MSGILTVEQKMIANLIAKVFGTANSRKLKSMQSTVAKINSFEPQISSLTDDQLAAKTNEFREQINKGKTLKSILPEAFAVVREASKRTLGQRHYDVQLMGGIVLFEGKITEMKTGEGKTLTAALPLYLHALAGKGAHLVTVNDYLANRDAEWMAPIYTSLGLSVAALQNSMDDAERKEAYQADILYATNNELGFDYLRDNMKFRFQDYVQRDLHYAIVDEVDSILIDEARTPLIISGPSDKGSNMYLIADRIVKRMDKKTDYEIDEKARAVHLTESGNDKAEKALGVRNLYAIENLNLLHHITQALRANTLFRLDVDYMVRDKQVLIVDEFTGRVLSGRRYSDGLHQALEAKEGVAIERESQTLASITLQNFFRMYSKLAGMAGTAVTEAEEFHRIYKLDVVVVPTNEPMIRDDKSDLIFLTKNAKYNAIVEDVKERKKKGQPVLIGTVAVETSELLSNILTMNGVAHNVLNAKQHEREAEVVTEAGHEGRITIATNMAGRGTDIKLTEKAVEAGGLYILGTERHESRRIDNQLRGRSGRQGDVGESRFYIALEDDRIRIFAGDSVKKNMQRWGMSEDESIESKSVSKLIERAQEKVEKHNFDIRKHLIEYDDVLNQHRTVIYSQRRDILASERDIYELVRDLISDMIQEVVFWYCPKRKINEEQVELVFELLSKITGLELKEFENGGIGTENSDQFERDLINFVLLKYSEYRSRQNQDMIKEAEKWLMLETIDQAWKQHMLNIDHLKEGINLRSWGQRNPLIEYKKEAFAMFQDMMKQIRSDVVHHIFHLQLEQFSSAEIEEKREKELDEISMTSGAQDGAKKQRKADKVGRNDPCSCGSDKKYKKCCGKEKA